MRKRFLATLALVGSATLIVALPTAETIAPQAEVGHYLWRWSQLPGPLDVYFEGVGGGLGAWGGLRAGAWAGAKLGIMAGGPMGAVVGGAVGAL